MFFLVVGVEIKRELLVGELNTVRKATLPMVAAAGGAILPAAIFEVIVRVRGAGCRAVFVRAQVRRARPTIAGVLLAATIPARVRLDALTFVRSTQPIAGRWCRPQRRSPDSSGHGRLPRARRPSAIASASSMLTPKRRSV